MNFITCRRVERAVINKTIRARPLQEKVQVDPKKTFEATMKRERVSQQTLEAYWKAVSNIDWLNKAKWRDAGFVVKRYDELLNEQGPDWTSDFKEVLEYMINFCIWRGKTFDEKRKKVNDVKKTGKMLCASTLAQTPKVILKICEYLHRSFKAENVCKTCGLSKYK